MHSRVMPPSHRSVRCMLATSIHLPGTVAHLNLVCVRERKNRPICSCMFLFSPIRSVELKGGEGWAVGMQQAMLCMLMM